MMTPAIRFLVAAILLVAAALATAIPESTQRTTEQLIPLRLHNVLVYQQGALLTALSNHSWPRIGSHDIRVAITESSNQSHRNTEENFQLLLRAVGQPSTAVARVVRSKTDVVVDPKVQQQIGDVQQRIAEFQTQLEDLQDESQRMKDDEKWLSSVVRAITEPRSQHKEAKNVFTGDEMFDAVQRLSAHSKTSGKVMRELVRSEARLLKDISGARNQLSALQQALNVRVLHITVEVDSPGEFELEIKWVSLAASWAPSYDLSIDTTTSQAESLAGHDQRSKKPLTLHYYAKIRQMSGLDWDQVSIQLSTGSVQRHETIPTLEPWWLTFTHRQHAAGGHPEFEKVSLKSQMRTASASMPHQSFASSRAGAAPQQFDESADTGVEGVSGSSAQASSFDGVEAVQQGISDVFTLKGLHTVAQEANPANAVRVPVAVLGFHVNLTALVFPKHSTSAFLRAEFFNDSPLSLLRGKGQAFLDGALLGVVSVPFTGVRGSKCMVDLGTDRTIEVTRQISQAATSDTQSGIFTSTKHRSASRDIIITVENKRSHPVDVIVRELIPQATHNSIHVTMREPYLHASVDEVLKDSKSFTNGLTLPLGNNATLVKYPGMLEWQRHIAASSRSTIFLGFDVSWSPQEARDVNLDL
jgi:uncharacterized protein (TIGR02231 family)